MRRALAIALSAALATASGRAAADPPPPAAPPDDKAPTGIVFRYDRPAERKYVRAIIEELASLALGEAEYQIDQSNSTDWDLAYDWPSFRSKLTLRSAAFDTNRFGTNWATHPAAGWLYYSAARSNRLSITESFLISVAASTLWEYLGEFREQVSVNDMVVTPVAGSVFAESTMQLGALLQRSKKTPATTALAWIFAGPKAAHDAIDDVTPLRGPGFDDVGLPASEWHRFRAVGGAGVTKQDRGPSQSDARVSISSKIIAIEGYEKLGRSTTFLESGEVSSIGVDVATGGGALVDLAVTTSMMPLAVYSKYLKTDARGRTVGGSLLAGMSTGFEYGVHDYDRDGGHAIDEIALVNAGASFAHAWHGGPFVLRTRLDTLVNFAGVGAYALARYAERADTATLPTVLREKGYYHALGATVRPGAEVQIGAFDIGGDVRIDWFEAITGLDRDRAVALDDVTVRDRRVWLRTSAGVTVTPHLHLSLCAERRMRNGRIGMVTASRGESALFADAELRF